MRIERTQNQRVMEEKHPLASGWLRTKLEQRSEVTDSQLFWVGIESPIAYFGFDLTKIEI